MKEGGGRGGGEDGISRRNHRALRGFAFEAVLRPSMGARNECNTVARVCMIERASMFTGSLTQSFKSLRA